MMNKRFVNIRRNFWIIVFLSVTVLLFGPLELFLSNGEELWFSAKEVLKVILPVFLSVVLLLCVMSFALPRKAARIFAMLLLGIALGSYIQGHFINIRYGTGLMDGTPIEWSQYNGYGIWSTAVWIICILLPFVIASLFQKKWKQVFRLFTFVSITFIVIQIPSIMIQAKNYKPNLNSDIMITQEGLFDISPKNNIIIFILDTLDEAYYLEFIESEPKYTEEVLAGFVHYDNCLASGSRTVLAVPSMFTGHPFIRTETYSEYKNKVWGEENALSILADAGYDVGFYSEAQLFSTESIRYISNFHDGGTHVGHWKIFAEKLLKLDLFKYAPHYLKRFFYIDTAEFDEAIDTADADAYVLNDPVFYNNYRTMGFTINESMEKAVRIYHLRGTHSFYVLSREGTRDTKATRQDTAAGNFHVIREMFDELREKGVFDSSYIILTADHGDSHWAEYPILLIKEPGSTGPYRDDHSPVSLFDFGIYLASIAGKELKDQPYGKKISSLSEGDERERHFFRSTTIDNKKVTIEYKTTGDVRDLNAFIEIQKHFDTKGADTPYYLGTVLSFAADATGNRYLVDGDWFNDDWRTFLRSDSGKMQFPIADMPKNGDLRVWIELNNDRVDGIDFSISANGNVVYKNRTGKELCAADIEFTVPVSYIGKGEPLTLDLKFENVTKELLENKKTRDKGLISMTSMKISK